MKAIGYLVSVALLLTLSMKAFGASDTELRIIAAAPEGSVLKLVRAILKSDSHNCEGMKTAVVRIGFDNAIVIDRMEPLVAKRIGSEDAAEGRISCILAFEVFLEGGVYAMMSSFRLGGSALIQSGHTMTMDLGSSIGEANRGSFSFETPALPHGKVYPFAGMALMAETEEVSYRCGRVITIGFELDFALGGDSASRESSKLSMAKLIGEMETGEIIPPFLELLMPCPVLRP